MAQEWDGVSPPTPQQWAAHQSEGGQQPGSGDHARGITHGESGAWDEGRAYSSRRAHNRAQREVKRTGVFTAADGSVTGGPGQWDEGITWKNAEERAQGFRDAHTRGISREGSQRRRGSVTKQYGRASKRNYRALQSQAARLEKEIARGGRPRRMAQLRDNLAETKGAIIHQEAELNIKGSHGRLRRQGAETGRNSTHDHSQPPPEVPPEYRRAGIFGLARPRWKT